VDSMGRRNTQVEPTCIENKGYSYARFSRRQFPSRGSIRISKTICRIPVQPFDYVVKAGQLARQKVSPG